MRQQTRQAAAWLKDAKSRMAPSFYQEMRQHAEIIASAQGGKLTMFHCRAAVREIVTEMALPYLDAMADAKGEPPEFDMGTR